jgi:Tol biopolymer transport system component
LFDLSSGQNQPLFTDSQMLGYAPEWSPDGSRLAYFDPQGGIRILDLSTKASQLIPNQLGEMGSWSPDGQKLMLVDMAFIGEGYTSHLVLADIKDGALHNIEREQTQISDGSPAWSPDGEWIAFGRKADSEGEPTPGQQLWLMHPDGSGARALVTDPQAHFGSFAWSPNAHSIAYLRFPLMQADARPEIWLIDVEAGEPIRLAEDGTLPSWLP